MIIIIAAAITLGALVLKHAGYNWFGLQSVQVTTILLIGAFMVFVGSLWQMQRDRNTTYDLLDMFMDNGRASLDKHITFVMAVLAIWWIVTQTLANKDVSERMIDVLMIFVIYRAGKEVINAIAKRPVEQPPDQDIQQQVVITPNAPAIPSAREVRPVKATKMTASPHRTATGKPTTRE